MPALITRCPACATMFKVVPDQLRVSEGWVRCGHCAEVFDAAAHLQPGSAAADTPSISPPGADAAHEAPTLLAADAPPLSEPAADDSLPTGEASADGPSEPLSIQSEIDESVLPPEPDSAQFAEEARALQEDPRDQPFALRREDLSGPGELMPREAVASSHPPEDELQDLTFVRQARRQALWGRPAVRASLLFVLLALAALLVGQVAMHERDRLAAAEPALRPWLARLCEPLGCRIGPPRDIDAIAIDSSSFNKLRPDAYRLQVTLKNRARTEVAMPALELTLTDSDEQPVLRRVLMPADLAARAAIAPASDWSGTVALGVADNAVAGRVAGYRVLAFYP
ncbi:DUF3426 domain-containing protein [Ramlibacter sp.]|uniref:DUF3426 domain-containing protein n=1 Tax=Ramlibacter sp. TaxID=1917967 RepID=UPI002C2BEF19|nr:DUF3426 domain-containing protein [Ramlibacter sp.]HWI82666.1 DUF3426 domain-containing protein [Ramlibacter sp.]